MSVAELVPNGADTPVTNANRDEYTRLYADYLLVRSVAAQFDAFQKGFLLLCDGPAFSLLTPRELEQLVVGVPHLDFRALQAGTTRIIRRSGTFGRSCTRGAPTTSAHCSPLPRAATGRRSADWASCASSCSAPAMTRWTC